MLELLLELLLRCIRNYLKSILSSKLRFSLVFILVFDPFQNPDSLLLNSISDDDDAFWQSSVFLKSAFHIHGTRAYSASLLVWKTRKMSLVCLSLVGAVADSARLEDVLVRHHSGPKNLRILHLDILVCWVQGRESKLLSERWRSTKVI